MRFLLGEGQAPSRGTSCLAEPGYTEAPAEGPEWEIARSKERDMALPPPGCVTLASFLPFLGLSVSICKMGRRAGRGGKGVCSL